MILNLTEKLRKKIEDYKKSNQYKEHPVNRQDIRFIEIMINLTELAWENHIKIEKCNFHWFQGSYIIDTNFTGEWKDISDLYSNIVDMLAKEKMILL